MDQEASTQPGSEHASVVTLRPFDLADVDAIMAWASDPVATAFMAWDAYASREALLAFLRDAVLPHPWFRAVCLGGGGGDPVVGAVSVTPTDDRCRAELGVVLARAHWGKKGVVATAALKRAVAAAFGDLEGVERVEAVVDVEDAASRRALEKAGFQREAVLRSYCVVKGSLRDMVIYSFISTGPLVD